MVDLRHGWVPGLIGEVARTHARYYSARWGFGAGFEATVAEGLAGFVRRAGEGDLLLSAWDGEAFAGSLILDAHDPAADRGLVHLRWFIAARPGGGLGRRMLGEACAWLDARGRACWLDTFAGLDAARGLYERYGWRLVAEGEATTWGTRVREQRFERSAGAGAAIAPRTPPS